MPERGRIATSRRRAVFITAGTLPHRMVDTGDPGPARQMPPGIRAPKDAFAEYHRIMQRAAREQEALNAHVIRSAAATTPRDKAAALDAAISAGERELTEFRLARDMLQAAAPTVILPPAPPRPSLDGLLSPEALRALVPTRMPPRPIPRPI